ncbi:PREDICTED: androglobin-like, partial [Priapulus caudatus]|uniref:Androglobin-like n=1 Tax=Priapulus caudatus TaxID=37621 RepID=A0ABM1F6X6_PRICU
NGYTFVAESRTGAQPALGSKFKLRLIGTVSPLLSPSHEVLPTAFATKEVRDYYVPSRDSVVMRYQIAIHKQDQLATIRFTTSRADVSATLLGPRQRRRVPPRGGEGRGRHPALIFRRNPGDDLKKIKSSKPSGMGSPGKSRPPTSISKTRLVDEVVAKRKVEDGDGEVHAYVVMATIDSQCWPLSRRDWKHVRKASCSDQERPRNKGKLLSEPLLKTPELDQQRDVAQKLLMEEYRACREE